MARKTEFRPNPDPAWVRDTLREDHAEWSRERGVVPDSRVIEEQVAEDLRRHEAKKREAKPAHRRIIRTSDPAADMARESGAELQRRAFNELQERRRVIARQRALVRDIKNPWARALRARMLELVRRVDGGGPTDFAYPAFAREYLSAYFDWKFRQGDFRGRTAREANMILSRKVEDIADRSNAIPGLGDWRRGT